MNKRTMHGGFSGKASEPVRPVAQSSLATKLQTNYPDCGLSMEVLENIIGAAETEVERLQSEVKRLHTAYSRPGISKSEGDRILKRYNETTAKLHDLGALNSL